MRVRVSYFQAIPFTLLKVTLQINIMTAPKQEFENKIWTETQVRIDEVYMKGFGFCILVFGYSTRS